MTPLVSIVVPVFNVENYLGACLDSLRQQTVSDIEIICVDDASTDGSASLIDGVTRQDTRVVFLKHTANRGLSAARNTGLHAARSPWVLFVDSDDLVSSRLCERALAAAACHSADAVFFNYAVFRDGEAPPPEPAAVAAILADQRMLMRRPAFAWTKLVRTDLMRNNRIEFPDGLCFEDIPVHWRLVIESERPVFLDEPLVWYRQRRGSITYRTDWSRADGILVCDLVRDYLRSTGRWAEWKDIFLVQQLANFAHIHAYYAIANPMLTKRVREEASLRMTPEHWSLILHGKDLPWWARDYLIASIRPTGCSGATLLLSALRHRLRDPIRCLWHRLRFARSF
jgi:glycosyltransferase involved in cell wall biosynthesis